MHHFEIVAKIGEGSFASVYKVIRKIDGGVYAMKKIKFMNATQREISNYLNEVRILASINSPYVIGYKEAVYDEESGCLLLLTEFASGGDLSAFIKDHQKRKERISEEEIWRITLQLLHGMKTLHQLNIFHRDIKSANILITKNAEQAKLADLNVSKVSKSGLAITQTGTPYYSSPEVWSDLPYNGKCDVWSLGCVLYEMATFRPPFLAPDILALRNKIAEGRFQRIPSSYSDDLFNFIKLCLLPNPKERPNVDSLMHHPIIRKRQYQFPRQKFSESSYDSIIDKENKLLQTIRIPKKGSFGTELKLRLPKSNYENLSQLVLTERNRGLSTVRSHIEQKLPELKRNASKGSMIKRESGMKPRLVYLR